MGLSNLFNSGGYMPAPLPPSPYPIGINPFYCQHNQEVALRIREHKMSFSGDDFTVKDARTGQPIFMVDGKAFSMRGAKTVTDMQGKPLFIIKNKLLSFHSTYNAFDPSHPDTPLFTVKSGFSWGTKFTITFNNVAGGRGETVLQLRGDVFDRSADITTQEGVPVGRISRQFANAGELLFDKQTYICSVAPGVDISLLLAICICLDEKANEGK